MTYTKTVTVCTPTQLEHNKKLLGGSNYCTNCTKFYPVLLNSSKNEVLLNL